ncbi:hypothetical protein FHW31_000757 [Enterobacter asburiae]|nr:hypothetical protein [Enterobacter asburiae]
MPYLAGWRLRLTRPTGPTGHTGHRRPGKRSATGRVFQRYTIKLTCAATIRHPRFLDYVQQHERVWVCTRQQIADHWRQVHPFQK